MPTTKTLIRSWLERGKTEGATHLIVVVDTFDWEDYPVFVKPEENVREKAKEYDNVNMQRIMEVYNLSMDWNLQLDERRAFHYD